MICGGSGSSKLVTALSKNLPPDYSASFIANVADNFWHNGLYICPDVDIVTYALAGNLDRSKGWGVAGDSVGQRDSLSKVTGLNEWFALGDADSALSTWRTNLLKIGWSLSSVTRRVCENLDINYPIIPATDDHVQTFVSTREGSVHLQEHWVKNRGNASPKHVDRVGIRTARANAEAIDSCRVNAIICPANPITSILPTVELSGIERSLSRAKNVIAISPFIGASAFSGPAASLMRAEGLEPSSIGVARLYSKFLKIILVDKAEEPMNLARISDLGIECIRTNIRINTEAQKSEITKELLSLI